jgi:cytochrome c oxidase subunit III
MSESNAKNRSNGAQEPEEYYSEYSQMMFHPHNVLLILLLIGISAMFLSLTLAFIYTRIQSGIPAIKLPVLFFFNTLILLCSSGTMVWANRAYKADETANYQKALKATLALSFFFLIMQFVAWYQLLSSGVAINSGNSASYLYLISILHFAHVIAGLPFLGIFLYNARRHMKEPVSVLVYFSDPERRLKLRLLNIYWHFLDALWIYLMLFFLINYFI